MTVDETSPTIAITQVDGNSITGNVINQAEANAIVTISGTVSDAQLNGNDDIVGQTVTVTLNGHNYTGTVQSGELGDTWSVNVSASDAQALTDGNYTVTANVSDKSGNAAPAASQTVTVDETSPTIAITQVDGNSITGNVINQAEAKAIVTISGTVSDAQLNGNDDIVGQTVTVTLNGHNYTGTVQSGELGDTWSVNVSASDAQALTDGNYTVTANVSDKSGNAAPAASQTVTVDETSPTIAITQVDGNSITGNVINQAEAKATVTISGTVSDAQLNGNDDIVGQTVTVTLNGHNYTGTVQSGELGDTWSVNVSASDAQALTDGNYTVTANVSDKSGNPATQASGTVTVDETSPTIAITQVDGNSITSNVINQAEAKATVTISGTVSDAQLNGNDDIVGQTVTVTLNGHNYTGTVQSGELGDTWSVNVSASDAQALTDGNYTVTANVSDKSGNPATQASGTVTVDETSPTIAITQVDGNSITSNVINQAEAKATVTISGTVSDAQLNGNDDIVGQTVTVTLNGHNYTGTVQSGELGDTWSVNVSASDAQALTDGNYTVTANVSDKSGNPATQASGTVTVDETSPTIAITQVDGNSITSNVINQAEAKATVTISGTVSDAQLNGNDDIVGQTVTVTLNGHNYTGTVQSGELGDTWSVNVSASDAQALTDGNYTVTANVSDKSGNPATQASGTVTVDETSPTIAITQVDGNSITSNVINQAEAKATVTISGTVSDAQLNGNDDIVGQTVTVTLNGHNYTGTVQSGELGDTWSVNVSASDAQALTDGNYTVTANVSDKSGNPATQASGTVTVDETSPTGSIHVWWGLEHEASESWTLTGLAYSDTGGSGVQSVQGFLGQHKYG